MCYFACLFGTLLKPLYIQRQYTVSALMKTRFKKNQSSNRTILVLLISREIDIDIKQYEMYCNFSK